MWRKKNVKNVRKVMSVDRKTYTNNNKKDMRNYKITFVEQIEIANFAKIIHY